jgi:hypothetical protein
MKDAPYKTTSIPHLRDKTMLQENTHTKPKFLSTRSSDSQFLCEENHR